MVGVPQRLSVHNTSAYNGFQNEATVVDVGDRQVSPVPVRTKQRLTYPTYLPYRVQRNQSSGHEQQT